MPQHYIKPLPAMRDFLNLLYWRVCESCVDEGRPV